MATISLCCYTQYIIRNRLRKANIGITTFVQDCTSHTQLNLKIILLQKEDDDILWYPLHNKSICYIYKWRGGKCKSNVCLYTHTKWKNVSKFLEKSDNLEHLSIRLAKTYGDIKYNGIGYSLNIIMLSSYLERIFETIIFRLYSRTFGF